jgi:predicted nucleic acid-binding protein
VVTAIEVCKYFSFFQIEPVVFNQDIFALAQTHNLTAYDASYLDLAIRKQAGLASLDKQLNDVAKTLGIDIIHTKYILNTN